MLIRKATTSDVHIIHKMINNYAKNNLMLPRSVAEIYENLRDYSLIDKNNKIIGCVSMHILWEDLAEIRSLAILNKYQNKGYGKMLVNHCIEEAKQLGIKKLFVLTYIPAYFKKFGFKEVAHNKLPHKVWVECIRCPKFPDCEEVPLVYNIKSWKTKKMK